MKRRVYISEEAFERLEYMKAQNQDWLSSNKGKKGMLDLLILGKTISKGSGRLKKYLKK